MFDILAKEVAACSSVRLVVTPIIAIVFVKSRISAVGTQSCPPSSAIFQSSFTESGIVLESFINQFSIFCKSDSVPLTVLRTPTKASSNSIAVLTQLVIAHRNVFRNQIAIETTGHINGIAATNFNTPENQPEKACTSWLQKLLVVAFTELNFACRRERPSSPVF